MDPNATTQWQATRAGEPGRGASIAGVVAAAGIALFAVVHTMAASPAASHEDDRIVGSAPPDDAAAGPASAPDAGPAPTPGIWATVPEMGAAAPDIVVSEGNDGSGGIGAVEDTVASSTEDPDREGADGEAGDTKGADGEAGDTEGADGEPGDLSSVPEGFALPPARAQVPQPSRLARGAALEAALVPPMRAREDRTGRELDTDVPIEAALAAEPPVIEPIIEAAHRKRLEPELLVALAWHESRFNPDAVSHAGAVGVMQVMPGTLDWIAGELDRSLDPRDPADNALAAAAYLDRLLSAHDDATYALIAYNQGPTALANDGPYPAAETFAEDVLGTRDQLREVRTVGAVQD